MTTPDSQRVVPADLLPCPFCNAEPAYFSGTDIQYGHGESSDYAGVRCSVCRVEISFCNYAGYQLTERMALAAEKWNRRAPAASPPVAPEDRRDGERWRRLCEYVDVGEGRVLINHNYVDSRKNFVAEMSDSSDLIVNMDNAIAADKTRIAAIDAAREG